MIEPAQFLALFCLAAFGPIRLNHKIAACRPDVCSMLKACLLRSCLSNSLQSCVFRAGAKPCLFTFYVLTSPEKGIKSIPETSRSHDSTMSCECRQSPRFHNAVPTAESTISHKCHRMLHASWFSFCRLRRASASCSCELPGSMQGHVQPTFQTSVTLVF